MRIDVDVKLTNLDAVRAKRKNVYLQIQELSHTLNELDMALREMGIEINQPTENTPAGMYK